MCSVIELCVLESIEKKACRFFPAPVPIFIFMLILVFSTEEISF